MELTAQTKIFVISISLLIGLFLNQNMLHFNLPDFCSLSYLVGIITLEKGVEIESPPKIWYDPNDNGDNDDRIENQIKFIPKNFVDKRSRTELIPYKTIYIHNGKSEAARNIFNRKLCTVNHCTATNNRRMINKVDLVLTMKTPISRPPGSPPEQIWVLYLLESPYHTQSLAYYEDTYNWTATYRHESDIVTPYDKFVTDRHSPPYTLKHFNKNYAAGKIKKVAWFVSNCDTTNGRLEYAMELGQYIQVDVYGDCGRLKCPRDENEKCLQMLKKDYKFYLAFENSNCREYITEKFFFNGLKHNVIPVVMGAAPVDYRRVAPPGSFIHVDDFKSPKDLAEYLRKIDENDTLFDEFFKWKETGNFIETKFWCRLCALAHEVPNHNAQFIYNNLEKWWNGPNVCIGNKSWSDDQIN